MKRKTGKDRIYAIGGLFTEDPNDPIPTTGVYKTQAQVDAANALAKRLAAKDQTMNADAAYVATKPGDPVAQFLGANGKPFTPAPTSVKQRQTRLPAGITLDNIQSQDGLYWYENNDGNLVEVDPTVVRDPRFRKKTVTNTPTYASGGEVDNQPDYNQMAGIAGAGFGLADSIINMFENSPSGYSKEPIVNASTVRNMVTPYGLGGEVDDGTDMMGNLQAMAEEYGVSVEELVQMLQGQADGYEDEATDSEEELDPDEETEEFAMGGIHIKKENRGKFTAAAKKAGMSVQAYARKILKSKNASPTMKKRANFAKNAAKWKHAFGGMSNDTIEVEGEEVIETPDGAIGEVKGAKHENGGVDMNVPNGTKIYSDRLQIDGKTMADRKVSRERAMARLTKLASKNEGDSILKATMERTAANHAKEEAEDMAIMQTLNNLNNKKSFAGGGVYSGEPVEDERQYQYRLPIDEIPLLSARSTAITDRGVVDNGIDIPNPGPIPIKDKFQIQDPKLSLGDYTGLAGNLFNAVAPIINTNRNRRATQPNINRFLGFGKDAITANDKAQDLAYSAATNKMTDVNTSANSARLRNRNSAQSVNTVRALDILTDMGVDKARNAAVDSRSNAMTGLLGQRGQIEMNIDRMEMTGEAQRDVADKMDTDNYYTNMAQNLTNFGTNIQGVGRNLNTAKSNRVDAQLISQLSKYGLSFDENGKLISNK